MLIVLEGPDGVGKTTLASQLHDVIQRVDPHSTVVTIRKGPPTQHPLDEYLTPLLSYRPGSGMHLILDRWHLGEFVYPRFSGRSTQLDDPTWWYLNQYIRRLGGLLVLCHTTPEQAAEVYHQRESTHPFEQPGVYTQVETLFWHAADAACLPQTLYRWNDEYSTSPENIVRTAQVRASYATHLSEFVTYVGRAKPDYLLLGDVRHGLDPRSVEAQSDLRPAFVPYPATSGHWLLSALLTSRKLADGVALANACDVDDFHELWIQLDCPKVAVLGRNAFAKAALSGIPKFGAAPHPQFGRRFYHRELVSYADALFRALESQEDLSKWRGSLTASTAPRSTAKSSRTSAAAAGAATPATAQLTT